MATSTNRQTMLNRLIQIKPQEVAYTLMNDQKRAAGRVMVILKKHGLIFLRADLLQTVDGPTLRLTCRNKTTFPSMQAIATALRAAGIDGEIDYKARLGMTGRQYWCYRVRQQETADHECVKSITYDEQFSTVYVLL